MNIVKLLTAAVFAFAILASPTFAEDQEAPCCAKAKLAGKECTHECCAEAKKANKVCEKCGGKKEEAKKPS